MDEGNDKPSIQQHSRSRNPRAPAPSYWQIAAGSESRDYTQRFIRHGLAFVGGETSISRLSEVAVGDRIILKIGKTSIAAVGTVFERDGRCGGCHDRPWLRDFDGWDLPAYRFVRWHVPKEPIEVGGLTRGTIARSNKPTLRQRVEQLLRDLEPMVELDPEPAPTRRVNDEEILDFLVRTGLRPAAADKLTESLARIRLLARYYYHNRQGWADVREHETRTFLILPLLLALGWPEQRLKVELGVPDEGRIDVACFAKPYGRDKDGKPNNQDCLVILESKGFEHGLDRAPAQARGYASHFPECRCIIVSNGYCYKAFERDTRSGDFSERPTAYLNLLNPQDAYPLDPSNVKGCLEVLRLLMPPG